MATDVQVQTGTEVHHEEDNSLWSWITTVDHKRIGKLYLVSAFLFFLFGGIEALLVRAQLTVPNAGFLSAQTYNELFTMHATTMIFLGVMPLSAAFFNFLIPLQIGARDVVFPRLNAFSYWVFLFGAIFIQLPFVLNLVPGLFDAPVVPDGGWFGYANQTSAKFSVGLSIDFWMIGLQIIGLASLAASFNFITTILNLRAPGMSLFRVPVFTWMAMVVNFLLAMSLPMITIGLVLLMFDRNYGTNFYSPERGGDPLLWQHLFWLFGHPEVYILILPAMGIVSEVLPTVSKKPLFGAPFVIFSGILIGFIGFGVWSHHMFTVGLGPVADAAFSITTMIIAVPTAVKIFNWLATMWGGRIVFNTAALFSISFVGLFTIGGLSGVMHASPPVDLQHQDSYFVVAHFHYVLFGGAIFGLFSGIYFYWPKMFGVMLDERMGKASWLIMFIGMNLTFFPMHFLGAQGMPRRYYTYDPGLNWELWNLVATIGAFILALGVLITTIAMIRGLLGQGEKAPADPWDGATLEWSLPTPVPHFNFQTVPTVHSDRPFWDEKHEGGPPVSQGKINEDPHKHVEMPPPSFWPIIAAFCVGMTITGFMLGGGGGEFNGGNFLNQVIFQGVFAIALLVSLLMWIKEDPTPR
ncbi:MAG: cytochrome ubiquinol oxidase subunit I [Deltaproteobacteria bacterium]|nr:MAG: cytochrome ubiquinol oxidase subunit I [Deltaproteobacteria bacterium]